MTKIKYTVKRKKTLKTIRSTAKMNIYTVSQKKTRHQTLGHNFTNYYPIFQNFSTSRIGNKFATNLRLNIPPRFKRVATLPCEI